jgi:hypothetical protein
MEIDLCKFDWIAISAIASFAMVFFTGLSLWQMRRQWEDERRPNLNFSVEAYRGEWYVLKISNTGKRDAYNINLNFNQEFIDSLINEKTKNTYKGLQDKPFTIEGGSCKYYMIQEVENSQNRRKNLANKKYNKIKITGKYCNKYIINVDICIDEYITGKLIVNDELTTCVEYIKKGLIVQNDQYYPIQKSLDVIAKSLSQNNEIKIENLVEKETEKRNRKKKKSIQSKN